MNNKTEDSPDNLENSRNQTGVDIEQLRRLIFGNDLNEIRRLIETSGDPALYAKELSKVIAEAIAIRGSRDDTLRKVLIPVVENVLKTTAKQSPAEMADSIFPLMGPAIRKSISETFHAMLESFNRTLEMSFSWKAVRWRIEAFRTGKPFGEIVLLNTLVYKVEQAFLIHSKTGIMLCGVTADNVLKQDGDLVSGMLTAIQDFVKNCFMSGEDSFDSIQMGEKALLIETGRLASVALVIRGNMPPDLRDKVRDTLDLIHLKVGSELKNFKGDLTPFRSVQYLLEDCLDQKFSDEFKKIPLPVKMIPIAIIISILAFFSVYKYYSIKFDSAIKEIDKKPGMMVNTSSGNIFTGWDIHVTRDPLADNVADILTLKGINVKRVYIKEVPIISVERHIVKKRIGAVLDIPAGWDVGYEYLRSTVYLSGVAPLSWITHKKEEILMIPGVDSVDTANIKDPNWDTLENLITALDGTYIEFSVGRHIPTGEQLEKMEKAVDALIKIKQLSDGMGLSVNLIVYGHADPTGIDLKNYELSEKRAKTIVAMLYGKGVSIPVRTYGFGSKYSELLENEDHTSRQIQLKVELLSREAVFNY